MVKVLGEFQKDGNRARGHLGKKECQPTWRQQVFSVRPLYCGEIENQEIIRASLSQYCEWTFNVLFARYWCGLIFLQYYVSLCLIITSVGVWGYLRFVGVCMLFCVCSLWEFMFGVLWQCVCVFFGVHVFLSLKCLRMCVLYIVSTRVYAVFNCVCIIRSSVCSVYVSYAAEARGRRMLAANYNRGAAFSLFIIFVISFYWSLCWCCWCLPNSMPFLHWGFGGSSSFSFTLVCLLSLGTSCTSSLHNWYRVALILKLLQGWPRGR